MIVKIESLGFGTRFQPLLNITYVICKVGKTS